MNCASKPGDSTNANMNPRLLITIYANPDYYPPTINAVRILRHHFQVHILCRNMDPAIEDWPSDVTVERQGDDASSRAKGALSPAAKLAEYWRFVARTRAIVAQSNPALIYAYDTHAFVASLMARPRGRGIALVYHAHELVLPESSPAGSMQRWISRAALAGTRRADAVVFPERSRARLWLAAAGDSRPPIIVPNCPAREYFPAPADWHDTIAQRYAAREAVYVGNVSAENGHLEGLRAIALLSGVRMRVIGLFRADFEPIFNALARELGVAERASLDGRLPQAELLSRASRATLGLSLHKPYDKNWEHLGSASNKLFEYAAMGLPVVVPDRPSYRDFLGDAPWVSYADIEDPRSIAGAVSGVLADRERYAAMSLAARRSFENDYNYERVFAPALDRLLELSKHRAECAA